MKRYKSDACFQVANEKCQCSQAKKADAGIVADIFYECTSKFKVEIGDTMALEGDKSVVDEEADQPIQRSDSMAQSVPRFSRIATMKRKDYG